MAAAAADPAAAVDGGDGDVEPPHHDPPTEGGDGVEAEITGDEADLISSEEDVVFVGPFSLRDLAWRAAQQRMGAISIFCFLKKR